MNTGASWAAPRPISELQGGDLAKAGLVFDAYDGFYYRTTGEHLSQGGMGTVFALQRRPRDSEIVEQCVAKVFHAEYLYQLRTDEVTRRDHAITTQSINRVANIWHPHLLPTYISTPIHENHLIITPRKHETLLEAVARGGMAPRRRVELLIQAIHGLAALHENRVLHRDFTLRNILLEAKAHHAYLFDFDLALSLDDIGRVTYKNHYQGRIFGSPGYSVPPEVLDPQLTDTAITTRLDTFAIGGAIYTLFTDQLPYGSTEDMWGLLVRIADGVVTGGNSTVDYPDTVPKVLRPIIESCLERDPGQRAGSVNAIAERLTSCLDQLGSADEARHTTLNPLEVTLSPAQRVDSVHESATDKGVTKEIILAVDSALNRYGYVVKRALGRVKNRSIFLATPDPELIANGQFPDANTFPKIVTAQNLSQVANGQEVLDLWFGRYLPVLHSARQGLMTTLYRAVYDEGSGHLFLFSEFVDDARFGTSLEDHELTLIEALSLGYLVARQVSRLHDQGMAHNNVSSGALLLKGLPHTRQVHPAMVGLVDPSIEPDALIKDVRKLAGLVMAWIRANRVEALDPRLRAIIDDLRHRLAAMSFNESVAPPTIHGFINSLADGLSALDYNYAVLRENGGDLDAYTLLLVSHSLYSRLWDS